MSKLRSRVYGELAKPAEVPAPSIPRRRIGDGDPHRRRHPAPLRLRRMSTRGKTASNSKL